VSVELYRMASELALTKGIVIADTKFELGYIDGELGRLLDCFYCLSAWVAAPAAAAVARRPRDLPLTLVASGSPFTQALLGVFAYRIFNLWLPLLPAAAVLPHLRRRFGRSFQALPRQS